MIKSMTGFASQEIKTDVYGRIYIEIRSSNHKFQEIVLHLPQGFLILEDKIKKLIESKIKRGRISCSLNMAAGPAPEVFINKALLSNYASAINRIKKIFNIKTDCSIDTLIQLPGVLALIENNSSRYKIWPLLKTSINKAVDKLLDARRKEGIALYGYFKSRVNIMDKYTKYTKSLAKRLIKARAATIESDEERSNFLRNSDITEELERLCFHIKNFRSKLHKNTPVGKELDFIAQEMQREANTLASKSFDAAISSMGVQIKSEIEKLREQVQNIE